MKKQNACIFKNKLFDKFVEYGTVILTVFTVYSTYQNVYYTVFISGHNSECLVIFLNKQFVFCDYNLYFSVNVKLLLNLTTFL